MIRQTLFALSIALASSSYALAGETQSPKNDSVRTAVPAPASSTATSAKPVGKTMTLAVPMPNGDVLNITLSMSKEGYPMQPGPNTVIYREWSDLQG